jgi:hypothetical protein
MKPNRTFNSIPSNNREWTRYLSGLFFANEWTTALLGCSTEPTGVARYTVSAGIVCLRIPDLSAVSNDVLCFLSDIPPAIVPERDQYCMARIINNGVTAVGIVQIGTDTGITLYKDLDLAAFAAAGTKGIKATNLVYALD